MLIESARVLQRLKTVSEGKGIDWACAESLAFASS